MLCIMQGQGAAGTSHRGPSANRHLSSESQQSAPPKVDEAADGTAPGEAAAEGEGQHSPETALTAARQAEQERRQQKQEARLEAAAAQSSARCVNRLSCQGGRPASMVGSKRGIQHSQNVTTTWVMMTEAGICARLC